MLKEEKELREKIDLMHSAFLGAGYSIDKAGIYKLITALVRAVREDCVGGAVEVMTHHVGKELTPDVAAEVVAAIRRKK